MESSHRVYTFPLRMKTECGGWRSPIMALELIPNTTVIFLRSLSGSTAKRFLALALVWPSANVSSSVTGVEFGYSHRRIRGLRFTSRSRLPKELQHRFKSAEFYRAGCCLVLLCFAGSLYRSYHEIGSATMCKICVALI